MMEQAGRATAEVIAARQDVSGLYVLVLVGPGNNGGDGLLAGEDEDWNELKRLVDKADIIADAFLGTGTRLPLRGTLAEILEVIGKSITARRLPVRKKLTSLTAPPLSPIPSSKS